MKKNKMKFKKDIMTVMECILQNQLLILNAVNKNWDEPMPNEFDRCFNETNKVMDNNIAPYIEYQNMWDNE